MKLLTSILFVCLSFSLGGAAQAKGRFLLTKQYYRQQLASEKDKKTTVNYYGGAVLSNATVYTVIWERAYHEVEQGISGFYKAVTNSDMMDFMDQYNTFVTSIDGKPGTQQHIGRGTFGGEFHIHPRVVGGATDDSEIQAEIQRQIDAGNLPKPDNNTLYMIHFPVNMMIDAFGATSCRQFCAYHFVHGDPKGYHWSYGVMPDITQAGCNVGCAYGNDYFSSSTVISSHELFEAITDPAPNTGDTPAWPTAWNASDGAEIGDLCAGGNNSLKTPTGYYVVQSEFDNIKHNCTNRDWTSK